MGKSGVSEINRMKQVTYFYTSAFFRHHDRELVQPAMKACTSEGIPKALAELREKELLRTAAE